MVGIFAQRARRRPNRLGVTICAVLSVRETTVTLQGLDAIDGTPILDIKPWFRESAPRGAEAQPAWVSELMARYW